MAIETRAVLLNNWARQALILILNRIASLFAPAKEIGTELFLRLDDGWFGNKYPRVNDHVWLWRLAAQLSFAPAERVAPLAAEAVKRGMSPASASGLSRKW